MSGAVPLLPYMLSWHGEGRLHLFCLLCVETVVSTRNQCTDVQCDSLSSPAHTVVFVLNWKALECIQGVPGGMDKTSGECSLG